MEIAKGIVISVAENSTGFLEFVSQIQQYSLGFFLENQYETIKKSKQYHSVHLGENGGILFASALLLLTYSVAKNDSKSIDGCDEALLMAFNGASPEIFSKVMDDVINKETNIEYQEWSAVYNYLKDNYGTWIRKFKFAGDYTMSDEMRYKKFIEYLDAI